MFKHAQNQSGLGKFKMAGTSPSLAIAEHPVFGGLDHAGIAGDAIADMARVSISTVAHWRKGEQGMPAQSLVFLTLVLAHLIEEMEILERRLEEAGRCWDDVLGDQLGVLRGALRAQEVFNATLSPDVICEGARAFRTWFETNAGHCLPMEMTLAGHTPPARVETS